MLMLTSLVWLLTQVFWLCGISQTWCVPPGSELSDKEMATDHEPSGNQNEPTDNDSIIVTTWTTYALLNLLNSN